MKLSKRDAMIVREVANKAARQKKMLKYWMSEGNSCLALKSLDRYDSFIEAMKSIVWLLDRTAPSFEELSIACAKALINGGKRK